MCFPLIPCEQHHVDEQVTFTESKIITPIRRIDFYSLFPVTASLAAAAAAAASPIKQRVYHTGCC